MINPVLACQTTKRASCCTGSFCVVPTETHSIRGKRRVWLVYLFMFSSLRFCRLPTGPHPPLRLAKRPIGVTQEGVQRYMSMMFYREYVGTTSVLVNRGRVHFFQEQKREKDSIRRDSDP